MDPWYLPAQQILCTYRAHKKETAWHVSLSSIVRTHCIWVQILEFPCDHAAMGSDWGTAS
jgi:hypothetical protein